jgi:uncharacterized membrane protein
MKIIIKCGVGKLKENKTTLRAIQNYLTKTLNGMALGLFSSLIIGLILKQIGDYMGFDMLSHFGKVAQLMMGPAIGAAVAYSINASALGVFASMVAGAIGAGTVVISPEGSALLKIGEPMGAFVSALIAAEFSKKIYNKTKFDIILVPALTIMVGGLTGMFISPIVALVMKNLGQLINIATELHPIPMGILVATMMGMILTLPISSAALAIGLGLSGLAAGASLVGCCAQMVGFAVISYKDNGMSGVIAQGLGTSMLQVPNIIKNPLIWIPPIVASAILGPVGTVLFKMKSNSIGAGMGTSGLVGQFGTIAAMGDSSYMMILIIKMALLHFIFPALISLLVAKVMFNKGLIKTGDMKIN